MNGSEMAEWAYLERYVLTFASVNACMLCWEMDYGVAPMGVSVLS